MNLSEITSLDTSSRIGVAVARTALDATRAQGDAAIALIQGAIEIAEATGDTSSRSAPAGQVDTYA